MVATRVATGTPDAERLRTFPDSFLSRGRPQAAWCGGPSPHGRRGPGAVVHDVAGPLEPLDRDRLPHRDRPAPPSRSRPGAGREAHRGAGRAVATPTSLPRPVELDRPSGAHRAA